MLRSPTGSVRYLKSISARVSPFSGHLKVFCLSGVAVSALSIYFWPQAFQRSDYGTPLSLSHFTPATISSCEITGDDTKLITLTIPPSLFPRAGDRCLDPIWSIFVKDDDIQVERPYTPLRGVDAHGRMTFWIKKYPDGEVGRWLHSKGVGDVVEIRGPSKTWEWKEGVWDEVIMVGDLFELS